jgi:CRP-like cAMP-binding protein
MATGKKANQEVFIDARAHAISKIGIFSQVPDFFKKIAVFFHFQAYERDEVILAANEKIEKIQFVISGSCKVAAVIPLIAHNNYGKVVFKPCPVRKSEFVEAGLDKCEEVVVETQPSIGPGDWIPYIPLPRDETSGAKWTKESIFLYRFKNPCECQVIAEEKVVIASIPFEDFMDLAMEDTLGKFLENTVVNRYPMEELQAQYLSQNAWEEHKHQVVQEIVGKKAEKKKR